MDFLIVLSNVLNPYSLSMIALGVLIGLVFGVIPGLNTPIAMALILPFTFTLGTIPTICVIMGIYMGGVSGGLVTAVMFKIPGTAASVATTFDGYPMAMKGEGLLALRIGTFASFFGGIFSSFALLLFAPLLSKIAIQFGPWEYFGATTLALSLICALSNGKLIKGFIAVGIGLFITTVGMSPIDGIATRFTFGNFNLENGFSLIAIVIGVFAMPEIINSTSKLTDLLKPMEVPKKFFYTLSFKEIKQYLGTFIRSSILGTIFGILPGLGGGPAGLVAYAQEKKFSKTPEAFGQGTGYGVAASESANNATTGGALIPTLALSIPGDTSTAIILGAFALQGIVTGPLLSINQPILFSTIIFIVFVANIFMFIMQGLSIRYMAKIIQAPKAYLIPTIAFFCLTGIMCINNNVFDLYYSIGFIILGYVLDKNGYPVAPLILGVVLGGVIETNLRRSISYYGSFTNCLSRISVGTLFFYIAVLVPLVSIISVIIQFSKDRKAVA